MAISTVDLQDIARRAKALDEWINERRQHLHRYPELSFHEVETSAFLRREVEAMGLETSAPVEAGKHGFHTELKSPANPDQYIILRADMDALPIQEETGAPFCSETDGKGHLCGHDCHSSMLLGALNILKDLREALPYSVRFLFQHAEEVAPGGAIDFVRAGLCGEDVLGAFGVHVSPQLTIGHFGLCAGPMMAMVGTHEVTIKGQGCHAARPHEGRDPVLAAAACLSALQQIASRRIPPTEEVVISTTMIQGGTAFNVIPSEVSFKGTMRTFNEARGPEIEQAIHEIVKETAAAYGCEADVFTEFTYPPLVNDPRAVEASRAALSEMFGPEAPVDIQKAMGGEDFAYYARERPSSFVYIGARREGDPYHGLHHPRFLPEGEILWTGSALLASMPFVAGRFLEK